jgi:hypothetical protein
MSLVLHKIKKYTYIFIHMQWAEGALLSTTLYSYGLNYCNMHIIFIEILSFHVNMHIFEVVIVLNNSAIIRLKCTHTGVYIHMYTYA